MKKLFTYLMVMATLLIGGGKAMAQSVTIDGVVYSVDGDHAYVSGNDGVGDTVVVLGKVTINEVEYPVTEIGTRAFYHCSSAIKTMIIQEGITSLGFESIYSCGNGSLETVSLPSTLEEIGHAAFAYNYNLKLDSLPQKLKAFTGVSAFFDCYNVTFTELPQGLTVIPDATFKGCASLTSLILPEGITEIGGRAFEDCTSLSSINIPSTVATIGKNAFYGCTSFPVEDGIRYADSYAINVTDNTLSEYALKENTRFLGSYLFDNCTNMTSVNIPSTVIEIGDFAFNRCGSLTSVNIPSGVVSIGYNTFDYCSSLTSVTLPETVTSIGGSAFSSCSSLTSVNIPSGVTLINGYTFFSCSSLPSVNIPSGVSTIGEYAFYNCSSLTSINLPKKLEEINGNAFYDCISLKRIINNSSLPIQKGSSSYGGVAYYAQEIMRGDTCINNWWFYTDDNGEHHLTHYEGTDSAVVLPADYLGTNYSIYGSVFSGHDEIVSVQIPEAVTSIGASAFSNCTNMKSITIPNSVVSIGDNAFYGCTSLPIEGGIRYADCYALEVTTNTLAEYKLKDNVRFFGDALFQNCSAMTSVNIPSGVTAIGANTFNGCSALTSLTLPDGVTSIGAGAFQGCSSLTSVNIPDGVTVVNDYTFYDCFALTSITLPDSLTSIGSYAFYSCSSLTSVDIPSRVTVINDYTFQYCSALVSMTLPEGVTSIGNGAFRNCSALTTITLSPSLTGIAFEAFYQCNNLQKIINYSNLPLTQGSSNYGGVAYYAQQIINVDTIIDGFWFDTDANGKHHLTYYEGTDSILTLPSDFQDGNYGIDANVFSGHNEIVSIQFPDGITSIGASAFSGCSALTSLTLPESVASIGSEAFYNCSSLTSVNIPSGVTAIGANTFNGCSALTSMTIPASVTSIGNYAFQGCTGLKELTIAEGGTTLSLGHNNTNYGGQFTECKLEKLYLGRNVTSNYGHSPFNGITTLKDVVVGDSVTFLEQYTFYNCTSLSSITLSENLTSIAREVFYNCSSLTSLHLPDSLKSIGNRAFYGCSSLASVNVPEGVSVIEGYTFSNCASLDSLTIPASVTSIGDYAFQGCTGLKELILADGGKTLSLGRNDHYDSGGLFTPCKLEKLYLGRNLSYNTEWYNGGYSPFYNQTALKEVVVGDSVTAIGANAFYNCKSLPSIHLHEGITSIGANAFLECGTLTYVYSDIESPAVLASSSLRNQAVIYVPEGTYVPYKELFPNNIIVDGAAQEVTVHVAIPGTLGEEVLTQIPYIRNVNSLKVSGTLNNDDISTITGSMVNLLHLDLSKVNMTSVSGIGHANLCSIVFPDSCKYISGYDNRENLTSVTLPDAVEALGENCFNSCDQLAEVTMSANLKTIGSRAFYQCGKLKEITFRDSLESIGSYAFYECSGLKSVSFGDGYTNILGYAFQYCTSLSVLTIGEGVSSNTNAFSGCGNITEIHIPNIESWLNSSFNYNHLPSIPNYVSSNTNLYIDGELVTDVVIPSSVTSIRPFAFSQMSGITSVTIPEGVTSLANNAFFNCSGLTEVTMSKGLKTISSEAFYGCNRLASVIIPDGVTTIDARAFAQCDSLRSITLPSTLSNCAAGAFSGSGLTEVTCPAFFPPVTGGDLIGANNCTLYVPEWTLNRYKLANNWNLFAAIEPISGIYPSTISVYTEEGLTIPAEGLAEGYTPNLELVRYDASNVGRLTLRGEKAMPLSTFRMEQTRDAGTMTSLVNYGTLTADSVATELTISANNWHYLTFPYDVKIADIATLGDWVIRRYDGASRARADFSSTWQNVPYDSILHAGEGYIWYSTNGNFTVPAIENDNRNLIFANDARYTQLKEHASATEANYGWNLIGNPYPCFYDTRFMEFSSPITVRSGNSYAAYSPVDDSYILSPLEAFFVQCSADNNVVGFTTEGRQTDNTVRTLTSAPSPTRSAAASRSVLNLYLENGSYADHTRLVVNESASMDYEIACDAAKFMSEDNSLPQLFTFVNNERMAINERPLADGKAALGVYIGKTGSYTLSLDTRATDTEVYLIDKHTGTETDLNSFSYDFTADAGTYNDRFEIVMKRIGETAITEEATAAVKVMGTTGAINILNATAPIYVYNAAGALVATQHGGDVTIEVAPGVYVVKVGDEIHKVSVIK